MKDYSAKLKYYESVMKFLTEWQQSKTEWAPFRNSYFVYAGRNYENKSTEEYIIKIKLWQDYDGDILELWGPENPYMKRTSGEQLENIERLKDIRFRVGGERYDKHIIIEIHLGFEKINERKLTEEIKEINKQFSGANITVYEHEGGCYVATAVYGSYDCPEVWTLRRFRDKTLAETWYGRAFIRLYYAISPTLVKYFGKAKWFQRLFRKPLDGFVKKLNASGFEDTPYDDKIY
mgnify:FL=1